MPIDVDFLNFLVANGYHPRGATVSGRYLCNLVLDQLLQRSQLLRDRAAAGTLVVNFEHQQQVGTKNWKIDMAVGRVHAPVPPANGQAISTGVPDYIEIAMETKGLFTAHAKARLNRQRDLDAFTSHAHAYSHATIAASIIPINSSSYFFSQGNLYKPISRQRPLGEFNANFSRQRTSREIVRDCINIFRSGFRNSVNDPPDRMEALGFVTFEYDNFQMYPGALPGHIAQHASAPCLAVPPARLQPGDQLHHDQMLARIAQLYDQRFP